MVVRLWLTFNGTQRAQLKGHTGAPHTLAFSPDGSMLASAATNDPVVRLWNASQGQLQAALEGHRTGVLALAFSPAGGLLATAADNVRLWCADTGAPRGALTDHIFPVAAVAFTADGATLVSADSSHTLRVWSVGSAGGLGSSGRMPTTPKGRGGGGGGPPAGVRAVAVLESESSGQLCALALSPDGRMVATGSAAGELHVFGLRGGGGVSTVRAAHAGQAALQGHRTGVLALAFSPAGGLLATAADNVRLWCADTGAPRGALTDHIFPVAAVAFTADGATLVSADSSHTLRVWSVGSAGGLGSSGRMPTTPKGRGGGGGGPPAGVRAVAVLESESSGQLCALALSPDGRMVATGSAAGELHVFGLRGGGGVSTVRAAHAGQGIIRLWATSEGAGRATAVLKGHSGLVLRLAWAAGGGLLASGSADGSVRLWAVDAGAGKQVSVLVGHREAVNRLSWAPSGRLLASGSRGAGSSGSVFVWEVRSGAAVYAVHAAYMAGEDVGVACPGAVCTVVSALEHAPHLTLLTEAAGGGAGGRGGRGGSDTVEAAGGLLRLRQVPAYCSFAAPACIAVQQGTFVMAFGAQVFFYGMR
ncbi:WD repeat domain-containing protein, partial [Tetrabaena socialis]